MVGVVVSTTALDEERLKDASQADGDAVNLSILVRNLAGNQLELHAQPEASVRDLKVVIEENWNFPPLCQRLLLECTTLNDGDKLSMYCCAESHTCTTLELTFVYVAPFDGDIHKATLAGDRDAVRTLMRLRDQDKMQKVPPSLAVIMRPALKHQLGWEGMRIALIEHGYDEEAVDRCILSLGRRACYDQALQLLETNVGKLPNNEAFLQWWRSHDQDIPDLKKSED